MNKLLQAALCGTVLKIDDKSKVIKFRQIIKGGRLER